MIVRRRWASLWLLVFACLAAGESPAQNMSQPTADTLFTVEAVPIDATAESGTAARDRALAQGQAEAWRRLAARLSPAEDAARVGGLSGFELEQVIRDIEVLNERTASTRYRADLSVRFRPQAVRNLMAARGARISDLIGPTTLILPVWRGPDKERLWDDPNPWRRAWEAARLPVTLVPMVVPLGDVADVGDIGADAALLGEPSAFPGIAARYSAQNVAVITATPVGGTSEMPAQIDLTIVNHTVGMDEAESATRSVVATAETADAAALYAKAVEAAAAQLGENWKRANAFGASAGGTIAAVASVERIEQWAELRKRLDAVPTVTETVTSRVAIGEVRFTLKYRGDQRQLALALSRQGLVLTPPAADAPEPLSTLRLSAGAASTPAL